MLFISVWLRFKLKYRPRGVQLCALNTMKNLSVHEREYGWPFNFYKLEK